MPRNRHTVEQTMTTLREADVTLSKGPWYTLAGPSGLLNTGTLAGEMSTAAARSVKRNGSGNLERENWRQTWADTAQSTECR